MMKIGESRTGSVAYTFENIRGETKYQIYDHSEQIITENDISFQSAKDFIANHWDGLLDEDHINKIQATTTLEELNHFASGLDYVVELEGENT